MSHLSCFFFYFSRYRSVFFIKLLYYHPFFYLFLTVPVFSIKLLYSRSLFTLTSKLVDHLFCRWAHETFHPFPDSPRPAMRASVAAAATQTGWHNKKSCHCLKEPVHAGPLSLQITNIMHKYIKRFRLVGEGKRGWDGEREKGVRSNTVRF